MFNRAMSESPRKRTINEASPRRKIKSSIPLKKKVKMQIVMWPPNVLPCEIYDLIVCYLTREDIQNMRLVNHEFEHKVSEYLFRRVVVPFKPELYSISEPSEFLPFSSEDAAADILGGSPGAVLLQDKGMRVFQGFGSHIQQFALSFEFDEDMLSKPPLKTDQEAVTTFWGIYRWPLKEYNRYSQLEGLEQTADETRTMANALRYITKAKELGLSIDGGLGWLSGPDYREKITRKPKVFGGPEYTQDEEPRKQQQKSLVTPNTFFSADPYEEDPISNVREVLLERMLRESGYEGSALTRSLRTLAESEAPAPINPLLLNTRSDLDPVRNESIEGALRASGYTGPASFSNMRTLVNQRDTPNARWDQQWEVPRTTTSSRFGPSTVINNSENTNIPLKPTDLTNAQKELLLELEWAQRAFMQSWAIAIIDNVDTFQGVETLTIARLPSRHLPIIKREDFWNSFPNLKKLSLAVIPDWREVVKLATGFVQDIRLEPSRAAGIVYGLIKHHIAPRENIKSLHFEWICGGEDAAGIFSRNKHILAAPFVAKSLDMVNMVNQPTILDLPHIEHLSIKNCWFSPHVLMRFTDAHRDSLLSLTLNSISLCAPPTRNAQPGPIIAPNHAPGGHHGNMVPPIPAAPALQGIQVMQGNVWQNMMQGMGHMGHMGHMGPIIPMGGGYHFPQPHGAGATAPPAPSPLASWCNNPREGSWAHIIDNLTPGETLAMQRFDPNRDFELPLVSPPSKLKKVEFKSCGYLLLPLEYDQSILQPVNPLPNPESAAFYRRRGEMDSHMMKPNDCSLGQIINFINSYEVMQLNMAFGMDIGWQQEDGGIDRLIAAAADGIVNGNRGRFSGVIEAASQSGH